MGGPLAKGDARMPVAEKLSDAGADLQLFTLLGALILIVLGAIQVIRVVKGGTLSTNFIKAFGLVVIAIFGTFLVFVSGTDEQKSPAYALLGTVAGYLAGSARGTSTTKDAADNEPGQTAAAPANQGENLL